MEQSPLAAPGYVLVVDDDRLQRTYLRGILEKNGYEVIEAADGEQGIAVCLESPVALVVVDIFMPRKDGIETILELKRRNPECRILAISGGGSVEDLSYLRYTRSFGADATLAKPVDPDEFLELVKKLHAGSEAAC